MEIHKPLTILISNQVNKLASKILAESNDKLVVKMDFFFNLDEITAFFKSKNALKFAKIKIS